MVQFNFDLVKGHQCVRDVETSPEQEFQPENRRDAPTRAGGSFARESHAPPSPPDVRRSHRSRPPSVRRREAAAAGDFPVSHHRHWLPPATGLRRLAAMSRDYVHGRGHRDVWASDATLIVRAGVQRRWTCDATCAGHPIPHGVAPLLLTPPIPSPFSFNGNSDREETRDSLIETQNREFQRRECMAWDGSKSSDDELDEIDPTSHWASWIWFIQLAQWRVELVDPTRPMASWMWFVQLTQWRVRCGLSNVSYVAYPTCLMAGRSILVWLFRCSGIVCSGD
ncbi:hypothetical protein DY000_02016340 [Brassica cretica]|uniref:Uncharacterized protein n=1 Tax=Brassica cretica TaxID=69181 RepID=A0ABQ7CLK7_BRACR|nr:hypothetical protein DY000_02016340 [Brassica cretica]